ncbi:MAG TPA: 30S ribosomal protein S11 [bacterium]|nr:30S ribosomal protein S11 [bacterium]HPL95444.1 30S ribosomal protein S11 [bacterium]
MTENSVAPAEVVAVEEKTESLNEEKTKLKNSASSSTVVVKGKKKKKAAPFLRGGRGQAHIKATYNNTIITISDLNGSVLLWATAGRAGFKGPKKATPYAAGVIVKSLADKIKQLGIKELDVFVKGVGMGREAAVRAFDTNGIKITAIKDMTPVPHGGVRPKKRRRV